MKIYRLSWIFLFFCTTATNIASAQLSADDKNYPDSLDRLFSGNSPDSIKARASMQLSDYWSDKDTLRSKNYLTSAEKLSAQYPYLQALCQYYRGSYYYDIDTRQSEQNFLKGAEALAHYKTKDAYFFSSRCWALYANLQQRQDNDLLMANVLLTKAIPLMQKAGNDNFLGKYYGDVAMVFTNRWQYDKAEEYYLQSIKVLETGKDIRPTTLFISYVNAATNYLYKDSTKPAKYLLDKAWAMLPGIPQPPNYMEYYQAECIYFRKTKEYARGIISVAKGIAIALAANDAYFAENLFFQKYKLLTGQGKYAEAKRILENIISNYTHDFSQNRMMHYYELSETYNRLGETKLAYAWLKKTMELKDSLSTKQIDQQINQLEIRYKASEKEKEIAALNAEKRQTVLVLKNNRLAKWLLISACTLLLAVAIFIFFYYRNYKKLAKQTEINYRQKLSELEHKQQFEITKAMLDAEEQERTRVARDLHDGLGGMLAGVKMNLSGWATNSNDGHAQDVELQRIIGQLDHSVTELRHIARNMMPQVLLQYGLETAIRELCESVMGNGLRIDFQAIDIERKMELPSQISIYRIVQEIFSNVIKHANATELFLQCSQHENRFYITAEDNGKGFQPGFLPGANGLGLSNIKNRIEYLNGLIDISSAPGEGTTINIEMDVDRK